MRNLRDAYEEVTSETDRPAGIPEDYSHAIVIGCDGRQLAAKRLK
jgi:hypothetical protein